MGENGSYFSKTKFRKFDFFKLKMTVKLKILYLILLNIGKACKVASCNQKKSLNHVFEVPKHSINKNKWNFLTVFSNSKNLSVKKSSKIF